MSGAVTRIGRKRAKTWSSFGELGRKPSEYEIVTHNMNHTWKQDGSQPLEMGPGVQGNAWLRDRRDAKLFGVANWNDFRDPDQLTYRKYCQVQDERETYVDELLKNFTVAKKADEGLGDAAVQLLSSTWTPQRYLAHAQMMLSAMIQQLAPSSYVGNCATFQTSDSLRRTQRIAYRTKQLDNAKPMVAFGTGERACWEQGADWQPVRKAIEMMLVEFDFDRVIVGFQLGLKPVLDNLFLAQFATVARAKGAEIDALIAENLYEDARRHQRWAIAFAQFVDANSGSARDEMRTIMADFRPIIDDAIVGASRLLATNSSAAVSNAYSARSGGLLSGQAGTDKAVCEAIQARVRADHEVMLADAGIAADA